MNQTNNFSEPDFKPNTNKMKKTQAQRILSYLKRGRSLNPLQALEKFGCFRLGARCFDLKKEGHPIQSKMIRLENGKRIASYSLRKAG